MWLLYILPLLGPDQCWTESCYNAASLTSSGKYAASGRISCHRWGPSSATSNFPSMPPGTPAGKWRTGMFPSQNSINFLAWWWVFPAQRREHRKWYCQHWLAAALCGFRQGSFPALDAATGGTWDILSEKHVFFHCHSPQKLPSSKLLLDTCKLWHFSFHCVNFRFRRHCLHASGHGFQRSRASSRNACGF